MLLIPDWILNTRGRPPSAGGPGTSHMFIQCQSALVILYQWETRGNDPCFPPTVEGGPGRHEDPNGIVVRSLDNLLFGWYGRVVSQWFWRSKCWHLSPLTASSDLFKLWATRDLKTITAKRELKEEFRSYIKISWWGNIWLSLSNSDS